MEYTSAWRQIWEEFSALTRRWVHLGWALGRNTLLNAASGNEERAWTKVDLWFDEYRGLGQRPQVREIRHGIEEACEAQEPLTDVWQAALKVVGKSWRRAARDHPIPMLAPRRLSPSVEASSLYRGQADLAWWVIPKVFRPQSKGSKSPGREEARKRLEIVDRIVSHIGRYHPRISFDQQLAIAQHYSDILGTGTWLVDATRDPFVALFFASDLPPDCIVNRQVGVVESFSINEYKRYFGDYGAPVEIDVPFVPRITAQRAAFIDCPHPHLWEQYLGPRITFYQHPGAVFEDKTYGVTRDRLYPEPDPYADQCSAISEHAGRKRAIRRPHQHGVGGRSLPWVERMDPLDGDDYLRIVRQLDPWCDWDDLDGPVRARATAVCTFHAEVWALQADRRRDEVSIPNVARSWNRLLDALNALSRPSPGDNRVPSLETLLVKYSDQANLSGHSSEEVDVLARDFLKRYPHLT